MYMRHMQNYKLDVRFQNYYPGIIKHSRVNVWYLPGLLPRGHCCGATSRKPFDLPAEISGKVIVLQW